MHESRPLQIAVAVVERAGYFLIGQRPTNAVQGGLWEFPGGKLLEGESPELAAVRECREETGLEVEVVGQYPGVVWEYPHGLVSLHFFACRPTNSDRPPREPFRWVAARELEHFAFPEANALLLERLQR